MTPEDVRMITWLLVGLIVGYAVRMRWGGVIDGGIERVKAKFHGR